MLAALEIKALHILITFILRSTVRSQVVPKFNDNTVLQEQSHIYC